MQRRRAPPLACAADVANVPKDEHGIGRRRGQHVPAVGEPAAPHLIGMLLEDAGRHLVGQGNAGREERRHTGRQAGRWEGNEQRYAIGEETSQENETNVIGKASSAGKLFSLPF